jgi:hypothetical protein
VLAGVGLLWLLLLGLGVAAPGCPSVGAIVGIVLWLLIVARIVALSGVLLPGPLLLGVSANRGQSNSCNISIEQPAVIMKSKRSRRGVNPTRWDLGRIAGLSLLRVRIVVLPPLRWRQREIVIE